MDEAAAFPAEDLALLRRLGLLAAPLPQKEGGRGLGIDPAAAIEVFDLLRMLGRANLSLGRLFEAHVNVVRLVVRYGGPDHLATVARAAHAGALFALWVTDAPRAPLHRTNGVLAGAKGPGSGAGSLRHALITVRDGGATRMALVELAGTEPVTPIGTAIHGMRAATNGTVRFDGTLLPDQALFGTDGDYLREPDLSTGAWRGMAVALGGLDTLIDLVRTQLRARGHHETAMQQTRFGEMLIAQETASLWTRSAALRAEAATDPAANLVAYVNLARIAVESAGFEIMRHAQRALGLAAFVRPNPVERLLRDLATYLRQPAPDEVLLEGGRHGLAR